MNESDINASESDANQRSTLLEGADFLPDSFPVVVLMQRSPVKDNRWIDFRWELLSVLTAGNAADVDAKPSATSTEEPTDNTLQKIVRYDDLAIKLFPDEAESYYHNLMMEQPRCFVVCRESGEDNTPIPVLVTASFDEANAYVEGDERVESVSLPESLFNPVESFVLNHYVPVKRIKRKRKNWKKSS